MAKLLKLTVLLTLISPVFAQDEQIQAYQYLVPLPGTKNIAISDWVYSLEFTSINGMAFSPELVQYDIRGREIFKTVLGLKNGSEIVRWNITENAINSRLRSVVVLSDQPLTGQLWMWNQEYGQVNGVQFAEALTNQLVLPFIPQSYFEMTTSFALQGFSQTGQPSEVSFYLVDINERLQEPLVLRGNLASYGYIVGTPELTLSLGGLDGVVSPSWAEIKPLFPDYQIAGFQTFTREDPSKAFIFQSAAAELSGVGMSRGHIIFSPEEDLRSRYEFAFTNPYSYSVQLSLELFFEEYEPLVDEVILKSKSIVVTLDALERELFNLGENLFEALGNVDARRLEFHAYVDAEDIRVPAEIYALSFQMGPQGEMGSSLFSSEGTHLRTWLADFEGSITELELISTGRQFLQYPDIELVEGVEVPAGQPFLVSEDSVLDVRFLTEDGRIHFVPFQFSAGKYFPKLSLDKVSSIFGSERLGAVQVMISVASGSPIIAKLTRRAGNDIAVINPYIYSLGEFPSP